LAAFVRAIYLFRFLWVLPMGKRRAQLEQLLVDFPDDPEIRYGLAMDSAGDGLDEQCVQELRSIVSLNPEFIPSYLQLGQALVRLEKDAEAAEVYRSGIKQARLVGNGAAADEMARFLDQLN